MADAINNNPMMPIDDLTYKTDSVRKGSSELKEVTGDSTLGKEEFLQLLVTQLQNQDPLNPQDDTQFIAQLAQFSSLEQMQNLSATMSNSSAYDLVGRQVIVNHKDATGATSEVKGIVDYVEKVNGDAFLVIDGSRYNLDELVKVMDTTYAAKEYLPKVENQSVTYDMTNPKSVRIKGINLGTNGYEASSVAVSLNGEYISKDYLNFDDDVLTISPEAFGKITPGNYYLGLFFDDPYATSITDKVNVKVVNSGIIQDDEG